MAANIGIVYGRVLDAAGNPLVDAQLTLRSSDNQYPERIIRTNKVGDYEFKGLAGDVGRHDVDGHAVPVHVGRE